MARQPRYVPLNVYLNSRLVGQLRRDAAGGIAFQYDNGWLAWAHTLPVSLSLPLREAAYTGTSVLAVFENLLPDNGDLRRHIAARTHAEGTDAYSLLNAIGRDCVGALQFLPPDIDPGQAGVINGVPISKGEISILLANLATSPLGIGEDQEFRISVAGAQEKTALLYWNRRWYKPHGTTATTHIFKPSIGRLPNGLDLTHSVENEYLCLKLLAAIGLPAAKAQMATYGERRVLIVERFDRLWAQDGRLLRLPRRTAARLFLSFRLTSIRATVDPESKPFFICCAGAIPLRRIRGPFSKRRLRSGYWARRMGTPRTSVFFCCPAVATT